jgi:plasmid stability protein
MKDIQYTIRGIPARLDAHIRSRAAKEHKSLNEAVLEIMKAGSGLAGEAVRHSDLDDLAGSWVNDPEFDRAIEEMDRVDPELWK